MWLSGSRPGGATSAGCGCASGSRWSRSNRPWVNELSVVTDTAAASQPETRRGRRGKQRGSGGSAGPADHSQQRSYGKTAKVGALWSVLRESITQLIGIPTTLILARLLSPTDFGIAAAATFF